MVVGRVEPVCSADDVKSRNPTPTPAACSPPDNLHPQTARTLGVCIWPERPHRSTGSETLVNEIGVVVCCKTGGSARPPNAAPTCGHGQSSVRAAPRARVA